MFSIFKKKKDSNENINTFEVELTASVLAYEIARSDGKISASEEQLLLEEVSKISKKIGKDEMRTGWEHWLQHLDLGKNCQKKNGNWKRVLNTSIN